MPSHQSKKIQKLGFSVKKTPKSDWMQLSSTSSAKHTGTVTNKSVRDFANLPNRKIPSAVSLSIKYQSDDGTPKHRSMTVRNPKVAHGKRYDAGHKIGQQNGGSGTNSTNIFAQHPVPNRYPAKGAVYTMSQNWTPRKNTVNSWRRMEDKINRKVAKYGSADVRFKVVSYHK